MNSDSHTDPARAAEAEATLLALWILTTSLLLMAEGALSRNAAAMLNGLRVHAVTLALTGTVCLLRRATKSLELAVLGLTALLAPVLWLGRFWAIVPLAAAGIVFFASMNGREVWRTAARPGVWLASAAGALLVLSVSHYADFLTLEKLRYGLAHQDTLFHASVASMIKTYGVVSSGINGLVELHYHVLSHRFIATVSVLAGLNTLEAYGIVPIIVLCPLVLVGAAWCAWRVAGEAPPSAVVAAWMTVCGVLALLVLLPLARWAVWDSYFVSESYALSLPFLLLAIPLIASPRLSVRDSAVAAALCVLAGLSKTSVGMLGLALLWVRVVALGGGLDRRALLAIAVVATVLLAYVLAGAVRGRMNDPFNPFFFAQQYSVFGEQLHEAVQRILAGRMPGIGVAARAAVAAGSFMFFQFLLAWVVIVRRWTATGARSLLRHPDSLFCIVALAVAAGPLMFEIVSVWYFLNPPTFVALPFLAAGASRRLAVARPVPRRMAAGLVVLVVSALAVRGYAEGTRIFLKTRASLDGAGPAIESVDALLALRTPHRARDVVFALDESFPRFPTGVWHCAMMPFVYPAVTERAWTGVIEAPATCPYDDYGYPAYFRSPRVLAPAVIPPSARIVRPGPLVARRAP